MSSLSLLNSSGVMPFLTLTAVFLFIGPVLIMGIATMWSNLKQKISDELSAHVTRIVNDLDTKNNTPEIKNISAEIKKINSRDAGYAFEAQKILLMVNNVTTRLDNIEEACCNDFGNVSSEFTSIKTSIEALQNEMIQCYAIAQRLQVNFDQLSVANHSSSSESSSSQLSDSALEENRSHSN